MIGGCYASLSSSVRPHWFISMKPACSVSTLSSTWPLLIKLPLVYDTNLLVLATTSYNKGFVAQVEVGPWDGQLGTELKALRERQGLLTLAFCIVGAPSTIPKATNLLS